MSTIIREVRTVFTATATKLNSVLQSINQGMNKVSKHTQEASKKTQTEFGKVADAVEKAQKKIEKTASSIQMVGGKMRSAGQSLSLYVTAPIAAAGAATVKTGMDFERTMSKVQAVSGATGKELQALEKQARDLGATTQFSATEAAEGMSFLAMAGFKTNEIMEAMPGMLSLAAAGSLDLGRAADITSNIMSGFSMKAQESGHVSDVLAQAAASANTNVEQLGEAMKYLAPASNSLGWGVEESTAAVMAFSDAGIQGSMAGQAFASSLTRLASPTTETSKLMERTGIQFFDAAGNMLPLVDVVKMLEEQTAGMTQEMKVATLTQLFGAEAYKHWAVLLEKGSDELGKNTKMLIEADGAADQMAKTMNDNLSGDWKEFMSAVSELALQFYELLQPALRKMVQWLTELARTIQGLSPHLKTVMVIFAAIAAAIGPLLMGGGMFLIFLHQVMLSIGPVLGLLARFSSVIGFLQLAFAALISPIGLTIAAFVALGAGIVTLYRKSETFRNIVDTSWSAVKNTVLTAAQAISDATSHMWDVGIEKANQLGDKAREWGKAIGTGITQGFQSVTSFFSKAGSYVAQVFGDGFVEQIKFAFSNLSGIISILAPTLTGLALGFLGVGGPIALVIGGVVSLIGFLYRLSQTNEDVAKMFGDAWKGIKNTFQPIIQVFKDSFDEVLKELGPEFKKTGDVIKNSLADLKPTFSDAFKELAPLVSLTISELGDAVGKILPVIVPMASELIGLWLEVQQSVWSAVFEIISTVLPMLLDAFKQVFPLVLSIVKAVLPVVISLITSLVPVILEIVQAVLPVLLSIVKAVFPVILTIIKSVLPVIVTLLNVVIDVVLMLVKSVLPLILSIVQAVFPVVLSIIKAVIPLIVGLLKLVTSIITTVLIPSIETILKIVQVVFPAIIKVIQNAVTIITNIIKFWSAVLKGDWSAAWEAVETILKTVWDSIKTIIKAALNVIVLVLQGAWESIKSVTSTVFNWIKSFLISIWDGIKSLIGSAVNSIKNGITSAWNAIKNTTSNVFNAIKSFLSTLWNGIKSLIGSAVNSIKNGITSAWNAIKNTTSNVFNAIKSFLSTLWNSIKTTISDLVNRIKDNIVTAWNTTKTRTTEIFESIKTKVKTIFDDLVDAAKQLPGRIGDGLKSMADKVGDGVKAVGNKMASGLENVINKITQDGINAILKKMGVETNLVPKLEIPRFKTGGVHQGGPFIAGDGGEEELIRFPDGTMTLSPATDTLYYGEKGTQILNGKQTKQALQSVIPHYNKGLNKFSNGAKAIGEWTKDKAVSAGNATKKVAAAGKDKVIAGAKKVGDVIGDVWEYASNPKKLLDKVLNTLDLTLPTINGTLSEFMKKGVSKVKNGGVDLLTKKFKELNPFEGGGSNTTGPAGKGAARWRSTIIAAAARMNEAITEFDIQGIIAQIHRESGGNQNIVQSPLVRDINTRMGNPARGLLQYIPQTFRAYAMKGHNNIYSGYDQLLAFFNNTTWRRDNPRGARGWGPRGRRKYEKGGIINHEHEAVVGEGGKKEVIIPLEQFRQRALQLFKYVGEYFGFDMDELMSGGMSSLIGSISSFTRNVSSSLINPTPLAEETYQSIQQRGINSSTFYSNQSNVTPSSAQNHIIHNHLTVELDGKAVAKGTYKHVTDLQQKDRYNKGRF